MSLEVSPAITTLAVQETAEFSAVARDEFGNVVSGTVTWGTTEEAGSIDSSGLFTADMAAGTFADLVTASVQTDTGELAATASVTVEPGPIFQVMLQPNEATLDIGSTQPFVVEVLDEFGNQIPDAMILWESTGDAGTIDAGGEFTAGTKVGSYPGALRVDVARGTERVMVTADVSVQPGPPATLEVSPSSATIAVRDVAQFIAVARDEFGNLVPGTLEWGVVREGGVIAKDGQFTASTVAGIYTDTVTASFQTDSGELIATASVTVEPGPLSSLTVEPAEVTLDVGATRPFTIRVFDEFGNELSGVLASWDTVANVGDVDANGVFTAGTQAGEFTGAIRVEVAKRTEVASAAVDVNIRPGPLASIEVQPSLIVLERGATQRFTAVGFDQYGNDVPELAFLWESTGGNIDQLGVFTAVGIPARSRVDASATFMNSAATGSATVLVNLAPNPSFEKGEDSPEGWTPQQRRADATLEWDTAIAHGGRHSIKITGSRGAGSGFPGWETQEKIPIDSEEVYEFSAWYYITDIGVSPWMDMRIYDSTGTYKGGVSTGTSSVRPAPNQWLHWVYTFNPSASRIFPDIAEVKLGLRLSFNYEIAGVPEGTVTTITYDDVFFRVREP